MRLFCFRKKDRAKNEAAPAAEGRPRKWRARLPWVLVVLLVITLAATAGLPMLVEAAVNRILADVTTQGQLALRVRRITLFHTDLAVTTSEPQEFSVENVALEYSPWRLLVRRHIDKIAVHGVTLFVDYNEKGLSLPLLKMFAQKKDAPPAPKKTAAPFRLNSLPVTVGKIELRGTGQMSFPVSRGPDVFFPVSFHADLTAWKDSWETVDYAFIVWMPGTSMLSAKGRFFGATHRVYGKMKGRIDSRELPGVWRDRVPGGGFAAVEVEDTSFDIDLSPLRIHKIEGCVKLPHRTTLPGNVALDGCPEIRFSGDEKALKAEWTVLPVTVAGRTVKLDSGSFRWDAGAAKGEGDLRVSAGSCAGRIPVQVRRTPEKTWEVRFSTEPAGTAPFPKGEGIFTFADGKFRLDGAWQAFAYAMSAGTLKTDSCRITADGTFADCRADLRIENAAMIGKGGKWNARLPRIGFSANWRDGRLAGLLRADKGTAAVPAAQAKLSGISLDMPVAFPFAEWKAGTLLVDAVTVRDKPMGHFRTALKYKLWELELAGSGELGGLRPAVSAKGAWKADGIHFAADVKMPLQPVSEEQLLAPWADKLGDLKFSGQAELSADLKLEKGIPSGHCSVQLKNGKVTSAERHLEVSGLTMRFSLPYLPALRSDGGQSIRCESIRFGNIETGPLRLMLRMDAPDSWCLERLSLNWCGGQVRSEFIRFNPKAKRILLSVHCDRLDPVAMLVQLGAGQGVGNGDARISGSMQVSLAPDGGGIRVRDSFLYSTPGESGHVELAFSEAVKKAQSAGAVFDMTQAALRDFNYSWAKVRMTTENDLLKLSMQLNGSPAKPLYFTYAKEGIVKTDVPHKFQGILLDLNISLPLNDIFDLVKKF